MKEPLPINVEILKWARESIGLTIKDVSNKLKRPEKLILEWESGKSSPTYPQLENLAYNIYKRPVAIFFFPNIPKEDTPQSEFRALPNTLLDKLPPEIIKSYRKAKAFQYNLKELYENEKPVNPNLVDGVALNTRSDMASVAAKIRKRLGYSIDDQFSWRTLDEAFKKWRSALEQEGIFVFKDAFGNDEYSGFCIYHEKYPLIYVNNSMSDSRQIFTLFHEIGHLLYNLGGIDFRDNRYFESLDRKYLMYERSCNKFANEFLVPAKIFNSMELTVSEERFDELASLFSVSREVILRNYLDRNLIDNNFYKDKVKKWLKRQKKSGGGNYYYNQRAYLGETYINLAFSKFYRKQLSLQKLSDFLNIKVKNVSTFEHYALG